MNEYVVLDFETTGFSPYYDTIIEVGAIIVSNGKICDQFNQLVNPGHYISSEISQITGITNAMVKNKPISKKVIPSLLKFVGERPIVAHNATFDKNFFIHELKK